jgi:hypothetical protein
MMAWEDKIRINNFGGMGWNAMDPNDYEGVSIISGTADAICTAGVVVQYN